MYFHSANVIFWWLWMYPAQMGYGPPSSDIPNAALSVPFVYPQQPFNVPRKQQGTLEDHVYLEGIHNCTFCSFGIPSTILW
jgi:hypothetical protein